MSRKRDHVGLDSRLRGNDVGVNSASELVDIYNSRLRGNDGVTDIMR